MLLHCLRRFLLVIAPLFVKLPMISRSNRTLSPARRVRLLLTTTCLCFDVAFVSCFAADVRFGIHTLLGPSIVCSYLQLAAVTATARQLLPLLRRFLLAILPSFDSATHHLSLYRPESVTRLSCSSPDLYSFTVQPPLFMLCILQHITVSVVALDLRFRIFCAAASTATSAIGSW